MRISIMKSLEKVHIFDIKSSIHKSLETRQKSQIMDLSRLDLAMVLQHFYPTLLPLNHSNQIGVVVNKKMQKWSNHYIIGIRCISVAVNGQVDIDWDHSIVYNRTKSVISYKGSIKMFTSMNSMKDSTVRSTKNLIRFQIFDFSQLYKQPMPIPIGK